MVEQSHRIMDRFQNKLKILFKETQLIVKKKTKRGNGDDFMAAFAYGKYTNIAQATKSH